MTISGEKSIPPGKKGKLRRTRYSSGSVALYRKRTIGLPGSGLTQEINARRDHDPHVQVQHNAEHRAVAKTKFARINMRAPCSDPPSFSLQGGPSQATRSRSPSRARTARTGYPACRCAGSALTPWRRAFKSERLPMGQQAPHTKPEATPVTAVAAAPARLSRARGI